MFFLIPRIANLILKNFVSYFFFGKKSLWIISVGSGALAQGSTHFTSFSDFRKDQNAQIHQKLFGGPQMSPRVAWYQFETPLRALSTILPESDHFSQNLSGWSKNRFLRWTVGNQSSQKYGKCSFRSKQKILNTWLVSKTRLLAQKFPTVLRFCWGAVTFRSAKRIQKRLTVARNRNEKNI